MGNTSLHLHNTTQDSIINNSTITTIYLLSAILKNTSERMRKQRVCVPQTLLACQGTLPLRPRDVLVEHRK